MLAMATRKSIQKERSSRGTSATTTSSKIDGCPASSPSNRRRCHLFQSASSLTGNRKGDWYAHERCHELCDIMGVDSFNELIVLTQRLLNIREELLHRVFTLQPQNQPVPEEIMFLLLRTPLVAAVKLVGTSTSETIDMERRVYKVDWKFLVEGAKKNLESYELWQLKRMVAFEAPVAQL